MRKIPTVYLRDPDDRAHVLDVPNPECKWVFDGEGVATRKYDGTCVLFDGERWWARREVAMGKAVPAGYIALGRDEVTGKTVGWEPAEQSSWWKFLQEATGFSVTAAGRLDPVPFGEGTYELCGPRINKNREGYGRHVLVKHADASRVNVVGSPREVVAAVAAWNWEGVVWHHSNPNDGRMAKLKVRDLK